MSDRRPFKNFSADENTTWQLLWERQIPKAQQYASRWWLDGLAKIDLQPDRIPNFYVLNERFKELVGWELVSTDVIFSDGQDWFEHLARRQFLITEYIRDRKDLAYTPLPDIWHDTFGHLPLMAHQRYADYIEKFAHYALKFTKEERRSLGSLWWYTIEFGFMREHGAIKAFGAGLMSSPGEIENALSEKVARVPFSIEEFEKIDPSPHAFHDKLFILESFEQLESSVVDWVDSHFPERV
jgi:phenylalanine-4-hydroxylase